MPSMKRNDPKVFSVLSICCVFFFSPALFATDYTAMSSWKQEAQKSLAKSIELAKSIDKINETILDQCDQILEEIRIDKIGARRKHKPAPG